MTYQYASRIKETPEFPATIHLQWESGPYWEWNNQVGPVDLLTQVLEWAWKTGDTVAVVGSPQWYGVDPDYEAMVADIGCDACMEVDLS